ncbi:aminoglycoside phosphotransferase family protein [Streptomyces griseoruber]|uniref:aminoglycoside phosphotransferase family protein n=1 Tax=Streptomyces griseoruber TaxID=1943 RepID=UPI003791DACC
MIFPDLLPETFVRTTIDREGDHGARWLGELPGILRELADAWGCVPDGDVLHGGVGIVVPVMTPAHGPAVIKVSYPHPGNVHEPDAFAVWGGRGAVRLLARDDARFAMLLERVRAESLAEVEDTDEVAAVAGTVSRRLAVAAPGGLPRIRDMAAGWEEELRLDRVELAHGVAERSFGAALATVRELGPEQPRLVVHGDLHARNILRAEREPWLAVDPKGWAGDPAYDGGTLLKALGLRLISLDDRADVGKAALRVLDVFSEAAGLDRERVGRWAHFHVVRAAFHGRRHGFRVARGGPYLDRLNAFVDGLAGVLL